MHAAATLAPASAPGPLCTSATIRAIEREWLARLPHGTLMAQAARACALVVERSARAAARGLPVIALVGPGNNGGDALLAALFLREIGFDCQAWIGPMQPAAGSEAGEVLARWLDSGGTFLTTAELLARADSGAILIDGLFGIGLARPIAGAYAELIAALNATCCPVVAVDVPSGVDADTGAVVGAPGGSALRCVATVTMIADKPGLHTGTALEYTGAVTLADLGTGRRSDPDGWLIEASWVRKRLRTRPANSHKGSFGTVCVIGGAEGMRGAALLAGRGALAAGAGKVYISGPDGAAFDPGQPQLMTRDTEDALSAISALAIGCGLGCTPAAGVLLRRALAAPVGLVLDADGLNLLAADSDAGLTALARRCDHPTIITPHPLEASRLLGISVDQIESDRIAAACALARRGGCVALLKGAGTIVADPAGAWRINSSGSPALASAGTGDVLAGVAAALLAQGYGAFDSATLAAWLHGRAGERWSETHPRHAGLSAAELPTLITEVLHAN